VFFVDGVVVAATKEFRWKTAFELLAHVIFAVSGLAADTAATVLIF
jgi:hypothetical protein